jgi:hypothetical protein
MVEEDVKEVAVEEGDKAPLSRGWAYGGRDGSRKDATDVVVEEDVKEVAVEEGDKAPLSRGWAYGGRDGSRKDVRTSVEESP